MRRSRSGGGHTSPALGRQRPIDLKSLCRKNAHIQSELEWAYVNGWDVAEKGKNTLTVSTSWPSLLGRQTSQIGRRIEDEATPSHPTPQSGSASFPCSTATFGVGGAPLLGWNSTAFCGLSWEKRAGSQGKGSGCGELREGMAQLDFFRNYNSNSQNGGVEINPNSTRNLTKKVEISWRSVAVQIRAGQEKIDGRARLPTLTLRTIWCLFPSHPAVISVLPHF